MTDNRAVERAVGLLDDWLESLRGPCGYGGPVVHWWRDSVVYCGPGFDWRYEGIIEGYLTLYERTGEAAYLGKAVRAGDDVVAGQDQDGGFPLSSFELNPSGNGTPHEAAVDAALARLAAVLHGASDDRWEHFALAAQRNMTRLLARLWSGDARRIEDGERWFVPNKAATAIEALCGIARLNGRDDELQRYVVPTAEAILAHQVIAPGNPLDGAIAQASRGRQQVEKYFPFYVSRAVLGLCAAALAVEDERYLDAAARAIAFVARSRDVDGGLPQVLYPGTRRNAFPRWVAGAGDVVVAMDRMATAGHPVDPEPTVGWLLSGQLPTGGFKSAEGFAWQVSQRRRPGPPDARDLLPVVGWNDKALRALASRVTSVSAEVPAAPIDEDCLWQSRPARYREDGQRVEIAAGGSVVYSWRKGETWATWEVR